MDEKSNLQKMQITNSGKPVNFYSLDVIISIGYRIKSKNGVIFKRWANKVLKDYLMKSMPLIKKRLEYFKKIAKLIDIARKIDILIKNNTFEIISFHDKATILQPLDN